MAQGSRGWSSLLTGGEDWVHALEPEGGGAASLSVRLERQLSLVGYFRVLTGGSCLLDLP